MTPRPHPHIPATAVLMIAFGTVLLVPRFSAVFATATGGVSSRADSSIDDLSRDSLTGQFVGGTGRLDGLTGNLDFTWTSVFRNPTEHILTGHTENLSGSYKLP